MQWGGAPTGAAAAEGPPFIVGRGPVPRHHPRNPTLAGETRSDARVASEGPALREKTSRFTVGRGTGPRHASRRKKRLLGP